MWETGGSICRGFFVFVFVFVFVFAFVFLFGPIVCFITNALWEAGGSMWGGVIWDFWGDYTLDMPACGHFLS